MKPNLSILFARRYYVMTPLTSDLLKGRFRSLQGPISFSLSAMHPLNGKKMYIADIDFEAIRKGKDGKSPYGKSSEGS
jgi:hypothetical protein